MQTPIDQMEQLVEYGGKTLFDWVNAVMNSLGDRPFMESRMTEKQRPDVVPALLHIAAHHSSTKRIRLFRSPSRRTRG